MECLWRCASRAAYTNKGCCANQGVVSDSEIRGRGHGDAIAECPCKLVVLRYSTSADIVSVPISEPCTGLDSDGDSKSSRWG